MSEQWRRDVLESILFGADATPSDRLRAVELLAGLEPRELDRSFVRHVAGLEGESLDRELDATYLNDILRAVLSDKPVLGIDPSNFPSVRDMIRAEIDRRAGELADVDRINAEIQSRAEERARELYSSRAFTGADVEP